MFVSTHSLHLLNVTGKSWDIFINNYLNGYKKEKVYIFPNNSMALNLNE